MKTSDILPPGRLRGGARWMLPALGAITAIAAALRFTRLDWGIRDGMPFPDELLVWSRPLLAFTRYGIGLRSILDTSFVYPPLFGYLAGGAVGLAQVCGYVVDPKANVLAGPFLVARVVCATCSVIAVILTALLGWRFYGPAVGWRAGAIMAVMPLNVMQAHYISTDPLMIVMVVAALFASCRMRVHPGPASALLAGGAVAFAFSSKYTGLASAIAPAWVVLEVMVERRSFRPLLVLGSALALGFATGLLLACPPCFLRSHELFTWLGKYASYNNLPGSNWPNNFASPTLGWYARPYLYQLVASLPYALGWPVYLFAAAGVVMAAIRRSPPDRILLVFSTAFFLVVGSSNMTFPRYMLPLFPALAIFAADSLSRTPGPGLRATVTTLVLLYALVLSTSQVMRFSYTQQVAVADWLHQQSRSLPDGKPTVGIVAPSATMAVYSGLYPPFRDKGLEPVVVTPENWDAADVDFLVVPEWIATSARRDDPAGALASNLRHLEHGETRWVQARRWHSRYFDDRFYAWLDPAFAGDVWQGEIGFVVYERRPAS